MAKLLLERFEGIHFLPKYIYKKKVVSSALIVLPPKSLDIAFLVWISTKQGYERRGFASKLLKKLKGTLYFTSQKDTVTELKLKAIVSSWQDSTESGRKLLLKNGFRRSTKSDQLIWEVEIGTVEATEGQDSGKRIALADKARPDTPTGSKKGK